MLTASAGSKATQQTISYQGSMIMKIGIIVGSQRHPSNSAKIGQYLAKRLPVLAEGSESWTLDLGDNPLPLWDESIWQGADHWKTLLKPIGEELTACDGFIVLAPEYSGMVAPALKNFFLLADKKHLGHKPGLIVAVSSGRGGVTRSQSFAPPVIKTTALTGYQTMSLCAMQIMC